MSDIVERLRGYNPPDRVDQWSPVCGATLLSIARDIHDGADEIERLSAEVAQLTAERDGPRNRCPQCDQLRLELGEARHRLAALPADWRKDSSLETWFPITAMQMESLQAERDALLARLKDIKAQAGDATEYVLAQINTDLRARVEAAERDLMDGAMLLRRVSRLLTKADPTALAPRNAMDWLARRPWFKASPLRDDAAMEGGK